MPGPEGGLDMHMWLNQSNYEAAITMAGVRIFAGNASSPLRYYTTSFDHDFWPAFMSTSHLKEGCRDCSIPPCKEERFSTTYFFASTAENF